MPESTAKKQLLEQDLTPAKKLVSRDINSWLQTHQKSAAKNKNITLNTNLQSRYKVYKRLPPRFNSQESKPALNPIDTPNISALKRRKDDLMKTRSTNKWTGQNNTKPNTAEVSTGHQKKPLEWLMKLPLIHVNQFVAEQKQRQQFQQATAIPSVKNSAVTSRKTSLKKIDRKLKQRMENARLYNYKEFKELHNHNHNPSIRDFSAQNKEVIQQKICKNNYMGLLSSVRKSSKVVFELKMDKFSVRI